jgi:hypothetical protein
MDTKGYRRGTVPSSAAGVATNNDIEELKAGTAAPGRIASTNKAPAATASPKGYRCPAHVHGSSIYFEGGGLDDDQEESKGGER